MFFRLALRNVRHSMKDYAVYFVTLMLSVCIFYAFNSLDSQMVMLSVDTFAYASTIVILVEIVSVLIAAVMAFLIIYANNFIMRRRKREIATYLVLGMSVRKTAAMLVTETLLIGLLALAVGLGAGYLVSQAMSVLAGNLFGVSIRNYHFVFSSAALVKVLAYFGAAFGIVMLYNARTVKRQSLAEMLRAREKSEKPRVHRRALAVLLLAASVILIGFSYWIIFQGGVNAFAQTFGPALLANFTGTLFLFYGLSGAMLAAQKRANKRSLRGLRIFSDRQLLSRVHSNAVSMTFVCTMLFLTLVIVSSVSSVTAELDRAEEIQAPVDVSLTAYQEGEAPPVGTLVRHLETSGVSLDLFADYVEYPLYSTAVPLGEVADPGRLVIGEDGRERVKSTELDAIAVSDYNRLLALQGEEPISLPPDRYGIDVPNGRLADVVTAVPGETPLDVDGSVLRCWDGPPQHLSLWTTSRREELMWLIIPDDVARNLPAFLDVFCANYAGDGAQADRILAENTGLISGGSAEDGKSVPLYRMAIATEMLTLTRMSDSSVYLVGLYVGLILLVAGMAVLALQQLSGAVEDRERYELLRRLGASRTQIERSLLSQVVVYVALPLGIGAIHSVVGIAFMARAGGLLAYSDVASGVFSAALLIGIICGLYVVAAYMGARRIIRSRQSRRE